MAYRDARVRAYVQHCVATVPFYRHWFKEAGIAPTDIRGLDDLKRLPLLTKEQVQDNYRDMLSSAVPPRQRLTAHTSGTTGGGLRFATTRAALQEQWATWWRYWRWHGIQPGTWVGYFGGRSVVPPNQSTAPFWRYNYPGRQLLFSAYHMSPANLSAYVHELQRRRPPWLHGYPSLLALLATYLLDTGQEPGYQVRWITTGAENLLESQAQAITKAFGVRPRQHYGMAEAVANFSECESGKLHVDEDFAAVEFIPDNQAHAFRIVGTNFTNPATPLLRYDTQDVARLAEGACPCGRPGRILADVDGRLEDYVILRNGARLGRMDHIFKDLVHIREAQIYQRRPGELIFRVVPGSGFTKADEQMLLREAYQRVGDGAEIYVEYVECLARSPRGKLRFVVSEIPEAQLSNER